MPKLSAVISMNTQVSEGPSRLKIAHAEALMREALVLLDQAGESLAGTQLQYVIDTLYLKPSAPTQE